MMVRARRPRRRFFAPEVIQTSAMDCGPASLKCVLEGFGVPVSYGHLRDACHTDVDGTSINTLERAAVQLGVDAKQIMVPVDHVLLPEANALPAIAVVRLPTGNTHFVILWRNHAGRVQVMDPATGRRWPSAARALGELYEHQHRVPASGWKKWTESVEFRGALQRRMAGLGLRSDESARLIDYASRQPGWRPIAGLDAGVRMLDRLAARGDAASRGEPAVVLQRLVSKIVETGDEGAVPERYWSVRPGGPSGDGTSETVVLRGAVLVRMKGLLPASEARRTAQNVGGSAVPASDLTAALAAPSTSPLRHLLALLRPEAAAPVGVLLWAAVLAAGGVIVQAVLLRELLQAGEALVLPEQRLFGVILLIGLLVAFLALELPLVAGVVRFGRSLETRLRIRFLEKLPRLHDRYFQSRLASDLAQRAHTVHVLHQAPELVTRTIRIVMEIVCTLGVLAWLEADRWPTVLALGVGAIVVPLLLTSMIVERDLRVRTHTGALSRFYLDGLIGLFAVRAHAAERTLRREQAGLLAEWRIANDDLLGAAVAAETIQAVVAAAMAAWLVYTHVAANTDPSGLLMLVYWIMRLSTLSEELVQLGRQYPAHRNTTLRLLEPLGAAERGHSTDVSPVGREASSVSAPGPPHVRGVAIRMRDVSVRLSGRTILDKVSLDIPSGAHVAVVGASGAGKSTLAGVLLGWYSTSGGIEVDDMRLDEIARAALWRETAWVDPSVRLWNRSLHDNVRYGVDDGMRALGFAIDAADLRHVIENSPEGLQTPLGEGGGLVSGGEGQRVRLARAMLKRDVRMAILDEPFRGLDRDQRRVLLRRTRDLWATATLLCITHDIDETRDFDTVIVMGGGRVIESGPPSALERDPDSHFGRLLTTAQEVRDAAWSESEWRRLRVAAGQVVVESRPEQS